MHKLLLDSIYVNYDIFCDGINLGSLAKSLHNIFAGRKFKSSGMVRKRAACLRQKGKGRGRKPVGKYKLSSGILAKDQGKEEGFPSSLPL
jgi:hypothetical protein